MDFINQTSRCDMLHLALKNSDWIRLSTWELKENALISTRECLKYHQNLLNNFLSDNTDNNISSKDIDWIPKNLKIKSDRSIVRIKLLCGIDTLESLSTPGLWTEEDVCYL
jgi:nicotinic acid mononucleotide adenylyltransferase